MGAQSPRIVSFSGIDGAGKSTQISALKAWLSDGGLRVQPLGFWDDVVVARRFRQFISHSAFGGDQGIGTPEKPLQRRDKNVTSAPVIAMRFFLYLADAFSLRLTVRQARKSGADVIIFDRYIYDELANLPSNWRSAHVFSRLLLKLVPEPDVAYLIDADPLSARLRKPEYPLAFLRSNREAYLALSLRTGNITVVEPASIEEMEMAIRKVFLEKVNRSQSALSALPALQ
jgi:thymidylate kinase